MKSELSTSTARAPFDRVDADVILLSSDNVEFWVFKVILSLSSPIFENMFWLGSSQKSHSETSLPTFEVSESSTTLDTLLRLIYPTTTPALRSYNDAKDFLRAVAKYNISDDALPRAKELIAAQYLEEHFLSIYALSCRYGWKDLAQRAAMESLRLDVLDRTVPYVEEMEDMTAATYRRLLLYHRACAAAAHDADTNERWFPPTNYRRCAKCYRDVSNSGIKNYRTACKERLLRRPSPSTISALEIPDDVASTWFESSSVRCHHQPQYFQEFRRAYVTEVKRVISNVKLEFSQQGA